MHFSFSLPFTFLVIIYTRTLTGVLIIPLPQINCSPHEANSSRSNVSGATLRRNIDSRIWSCLVCRAPKLTDCYLFILHVILSTLISMKRCVQCLYMHIFHFSDRFSIQCAASTVVPLMHSFIEWIQSGCWHCSLVFWYSIFLVSAPKEVDFVVLFSVGVWRNTAKL